jgi:hypothetical protein
MSSFVTDLLPESLERCLLRMLPVSLSLMWSTAGNRVFWALQSTRLCGILQSLANFEQCAASNSKLKMQRKRERIYPRRLPVFLMNSSLSRPTAQPRTIPVLSKDGSPLSWTRSQRSSATVLRLHVPNLRELLHNYLGTATTQAE